MRYILHPQTGWPVFSVHAVCRIFEIGAHMSLKKKLPAFLFCFFSDVVFLAAAFMTFAMRWTRRFYPMDSFRTVYLVLSADTSGFDSETVASGIRGIIVPMALLYALYRALLFVLRKKRRRIDGRKVFAFSALYLLSALCVFIVLFQFWNYINFAREVKRPPLSSAFYRKNYVAPENITIIAPEKKRNLILIFMESMESSYTTIDDGGVFKEELIRNLSRMAKEQVNFSGTAEIGGGVNLEGTAWTGAGLLSKLTALPYFNPFRDNGERLTCLPRAVSLGDVLKKQGYDLIFSMGSEKQFENRDAFLETHGFTVHDINWYKQQGFLPQSYRVFWGFEDAKLYAFAKRELSDLGAGDKPFCYAMLTVDTHFPYGYLAKDAPREMPHPMMDALRTADRQVDDFIGWIKAQSWYADTMIVIMGDHCYLNAPKNNFIEAFSPLPPAKVNERRRFLDIFINPAVPVSIDMQKNRQFSSYDMLPTILECLGNRIEGRRIAFGVSLLSEHLTLVEEYGESTVNKETMRRTAEYEALK